MTDKAVRYVEETNGWEVGVGPTVIAVDEGVAKQVSTSTLKDDAYAFIFSQQGLMAWVSIEGTKISRVERQSRERVTKAAIVHEEASHTGAVRTRPLETQ
jgi:lipid-binding SYLF domain-containing protein